MGWIEVIIWIVVGVIYAIVEASGHSGRYSSFNSPGRYGILGVEDFSLSYDPLEGIRRTYEERLKVYYLHNKPKQYLLNKYCEAKFVRIKSKMYFYCKERTNGKSAGRYFEVKGNAEHVATMWAIIDMEFNGYTRFQDVKDLYYSLNQGLETRGGLRYYNEPFMNKLPAAQTNKSAQNEYCRMEVITGINGEKAIICSEIWGVKNFDKPRKFVINGDKLVLYGILSEFSKERDKMVDYLNLLYRYAMYPGCIIKELNEEEQPSDKPKYDEHNPEPIKYIHVDLSEDTKENKQQKSKQNEVPQDIKPEDVPEEPAKNIEKYNERNLDL